jgi:NOL1/NOP2/fmu family ribosome biogenesis protein
VCRLRKKGQKADNEAIFSSVSCTSKEAEEALKAWHLFANENINNSRHGVFHLRGTSLYRLPSYMKEVPPIKWDKAGLYLGEFQKGRFEPSQSMVMASKPEDFKRTIRFERNAQNIIRYLKGETIFADGEKGYTVVCMEDYPLGWAKQDAGMLKNLYPKGWRMM